MAISTFEENLIGIILNIFHNGYRYESPNGDVMKRMQNQILSVDLGKEFPILKARKISWGSAVANALSIVKPQAPRVNNGSIERVRSESVETIIASLSQNPMGVRASHVLPGSQENSICDHTWNIIDGKLNGCVSQAVCDVCVDVTTVVMTFSILNHMLSRHLGVSPGTMMFVWGDCYVPEKYSSGLSAWIDQHRKLLLIDMTSGTEGKNHLQEMMKENSSMSDVAKKANEEARSISHSDINVFASVPVLYYDPCVKSIWDASENHIRVKGYESFAEIKF